MCSLKEGEVGTGVAEEAVDEVVSEIRCGPGVEDGSSSEPGRALGIRGDLPDGGVPETVRWTRWMKRALLLVCTGERKSVKEKEAILIRRRTHISLHWSRLSSAKRKTVRERLTNEP